MICNGDRQPVGTTHARPRIGLVVPALEHGGGVPSVAEFVCDTIEQSRAFDLKIVSLAASYRDALSVSLTRPASWVRGVATSESIWQGRRFTRIGALGSEFEFQRYQPRVALTKVLSDCDFVQVVCGSPASACAVCGIGKPVAVHCATRAVVERRSRHAEARGLTDAWRRWMTTITDRMDRKALRSVDAIQVMNSWMLDYARDVNAGRSSIIRLVLPGIDSTCFRPAAHRDLQSNPYILTVGRLNDPRKNVLLLLDAFAALPSTMRAVTRLVLAGLVGPPPKLWARIKELRLADQVIFRDSPTVDELIALYQSATIFASSSDEEGFGMGIVEAMACGIPVVSTRSGGPDGIIRDGHDGYLVGVGDVSGFAERLSLLLSNEELNLRLGKAGRESVCDKFDTRVAGNALLETYDALLSSRAASVRGDRSHLSADRHLCPPV
jgi:glycosyltransferase involved in cell wall biosynthesis